MAMAERACNVFGHVWLLSECEGRAGARGDRPLEIVGDQVVGHNRYPRSQYPLTPVVLQLLLL